MPKYVTNFDWDSVMQGIDIKPKGYETYDNVRREEQRRIENMPAIFTLDIKTEKRTKNRKTV